MSSSSMPPVQLARILWLAFLGALVFYGVLAFVFLDPPSRHPQLGLLLVALAALSGGSLAAAFAFPWMFTRQVETYVQACIIRWAFVEAIGVYGLIARILGASITVSGAFLIVALAGLSMMGPGEDGEREFQEQRRL